MVSPPGFSSTWITERNTTWQAFADAAKRQATGTQALRAQMQAGSGTAPEHMAQRAWATRQRADAMTAMTKAFETLHGVLTPEQKALADQHFATMGPRGMRFGPHAG